MNLTIFASFFNISLHLSDTNFTPIIGILSQELSPLIQKQFPGYKSYIAASYVKFVESSGARVVPILINQSEEYYRNLINSLNGVLLPGGNTWLNNTNGYGEAGATIFHLIKEANTRGIHYPILGICLGYELLLYLDNEKVDMRTDCQSKNIALRLNFKDDFKSSHTFRNADQEIIKILSNEPVTFNSHQFCITEDNLKKYGLDKSWRVLSLNEDQPNNITFISSIESKEYPFLGLQFHPEKNTFEWNKKKIPHFPSAIKISRFFSDWLVKEAQKNTNKFKDSDQEIYTLIYNYDPTYTALKKSSFEQVYYFK